MPHSKKAGRFRFSLAAAFGVVTVSSVSLAALRFGDWRWARVMFTVTLGLLLAAILAAVYRAGAHRAFWIGFALFGWVYILFAFVPVFRVIEHHLIAKEVSSLLKEHVPDGNSGIVIGSGGSRISVFSFTQIIHSTIALIFALFGGLAGAYFYGTHRSREPERPDRDQDR